MHLKKGITPNFTAESFVVDAVKPTNPITYRLKDLQDLNLSTFTKKILTLPGTEANAKQWSDSSTELKYSGE